MSPEVQHLENAPIKEALIDIQVSPRPDLEINSLKQFHDSIKKDYPKEQIQKQFHISLNLGGTPKTAHTEEPTGFRYESDDGRQIVQARRDGYTFSRLEKYETWASLRSEAVRLWKIYQEIARPVSVKRVAVRYINSIPIEAPFEKYLLAPPISPQGLSVSIQEFLTRIVVHNDALDASAIITQALKKLDTDGTNPLILDIDVYKVVALDPDDKLIWSIIDSFHDLKNGLFFNSITDETMETFK